MNYAYAYASTMKQSYACYTNRLCLSHVGCSRDHRTYVSQAERAT